LGGGDRMTVNGKNINLYLLDGDPAGRLKCSFLNLTVVGYKIPRTHLSTCSEIKYLKQSGVYFLFGTDINDNPVVYIGQASIRKKKEGLLYRVKETHSTIDYWTEAVMLTTTNNSFGPTEISYLEHRFCLLARQANRYKVINIKEPNLGNPTEEKECEMEEYVGYAKIVMGVLGYKVFEPYISLIPGVHNEPKLYFVKAKVDATAVRTSEGFVVLKGSNINPDCVPSCPESAIRDRTRYADRISDNILTEDILFSSPSAAAKFVGGSSLSGNEMWRTEDGTLLKDIDKKS